MCICMCVYIYIYIYICKGRCIAAIVQHMWNSGCKRAVWVSATNELYHDAVRDLKELGSCCLYIYIYRERERERYVYVYDTHTYMRIYIYIYIMYTFISMVTCTSRTWGRTSPACRCASCPRAAPWTRRAPRRTRSCYSILYYSIVYYS